MQFCELGEADKPSVMLIPGTACSWEGEFSDVINELTKDYRIICVNFDGHYETNKNTFIHINEQTYGIERYIEKNYSGKLHAVYGSSLGGSIVGKLIERNKVKIDVAITGSTDFEQKSNPGAAISAIFVTAVFYYLIKAKRPIKMLMRFLEDMYGDAQKALRVIYKHISFKSLFNMYYTDLITTVADNIITENTQIYCLYGSEEDTCELVKRYLEHFPKAELIEINGMHHEELLIFHPDEWIKLIKKLL